MENSCECSEANLWCPDRRKEKIRYKIQRSPPGLLINCHDQNLIDEDELKLYTKNITLDASETKVIMEDCPIPKYSFGELFKDMDIEHLDVRNSLSKELIAGQFKGLGPTLKKLKFRTTDLTSISPDAFMGLENLTNLSFVNNYEFKIFPNGSDVFNPLTNLLYLEIRSYRDKRSKKPIIQELSDGLLDGLKELKWLITDVGTNPSSRLFQNNFNLKRLDIVNLDVESLAEDQKSMFFNLKELKYVYLEAKSIANFTDDLFKSNKKLSTFKFTGQNKRRDKCWRGRSNECIAKPKSFVKNLSSLKMFEIDYKRGEIVLNNDFFHGCDQLTHVKIIHR